MALPKIEMPSIIFDYTFPVSKKTITFRPYLVEDEKGFLSAGKSKDMAALIQNYDDVIKSRIITENVDLTKLCLIDYLHLCVYIRCKSKDEIYSGRLKKCKYCNQKNIEFEIDIINSLKIENENITSAMYTVNDKLKLKLCPLKRDFLLFGDNEKEVKPDEVDIFKYTIAHCIETIIYEGQPYKDFEISEIMTDIISKLSLPQIKGIFKEIATLVKMQCELQIYCPHCKKTNVLKEKSFLQFLN